jgi:hypothetical protein
MLMRPSHVVSLGTASDMVTKSSIEDFYKKASAQLPEGISKEIGHFNVFETEKLFDKKQAIVSCPTAEGLFIRSA